MSRCPERHNKKDETIECKSCNGRGKTGWWGTPCTDCQGKGRVTCRKCETCTKCNGTGQSWLFSCGECEGTGRVLRQQQPPHAAAKPKPVTPQKSLNTIGIEHYNAGNHTKAREFFQRAADQGDRQGQYNLGLMYHQGTGGYQSTSVAMGWFEKAAQQGHAEARKMVDNYYYQQQRAEREAEMQAKAKAEAAERENILAMMDADRRNSGNNY